MVRTCLVLFCASILSAQSSRQPLYGPGSPLLSIEPVRTAESATERVSPEGRVRSVPAVSEDTLRFHNTGDGVYVLLQQVHFPGAAVLRVHLEDFRLPAGAQVLVYGLTDAGQVTAIEGPFPLTGPLGDGGFWTRAVPGSRAVVELQSAAPLDTIPFQLREVAAGDGIEEARIEAQPASELRTSIYRGMPVTHRVVDGIGVWEGDILIGRAEELEPYDLAKHSRSAGAINGSFYRWPGGVVPYLIDPTLPNPARATAAVDHWNAQLAGNLRLVPRTTETDYIRFIPADPYTCSSYVGRIGGAQPINTGDYCSTGNLIHEVGHAVGLYHEQTRSDRDTYVSIQTANIQSSALHNFSISSNVLNIGPYDYGSIMHYGATAFSANGLPTIVTIPAGIPIGQRGGLSAGDISSVRSMYPAAGTTGPVSVTLASNPSGASLVADGQTVIAPSTLLWQPGSSHTISAPNVVTAGSSYLFTSWSDGGAQTHTVTAPSTGAATITANFAVRHRLTATSAAPTLGTVTVSPAATDGFYAANTSVTLTARPAAGACLTGWTGIVSTSNTFALLMSRPYTLAANFQTGSVTVPTAVTAASQAATYGIPITATSGCSWTAVSQTGFIRVNTAGGAASGTLSITLSRNNSRAARTGYVQVNNTTIAVTQSGR